MARKTKELVIGTVYGRLTVIGSTAIDEGDRRRGASICKCVCGTVKTVSNTFLTNGSTKSCGCLHRENTSKRVKENPPRLKHGMCRTITYNCWQGMVDRCTNPSCVVYHLYGGRGITVCDRWADPDRGILNFIEDMGERPSLDHSIDRIDGTKGYEPGNCRWATKCQQARNSAGKGASSGYKGIHPVKVKSGLHWAAEIRCTYTRFYLGCYETKEQAALAYNVASETLHGEYGVRNELPVIPARVAESVKRQVTERLSQIKLQRR